MSEKIIKWGFIGCGEVTKTKSGPAFQKVEHSEVVAVMSRDGAKAKAYAKERGIKRWYDDAQELIDAPLGQVTDGINIAWEYPLVRTYNRQLSMAAQCDVKRGHTMKEVHAEIREEIENIKLPEGYSFFWDSQYKDQKEAMAALTKYFPLAIIMLIIILVMLFGNFRQPLIIFLILPLSLIGMVFGLLLTGFQFGFFCIAGWLGLLGMIIKNVIVLLDEVNVQRRAGIAPYTAVIEATVSRVRPVLMAALTTVFGSIPLLFDVVFGGMAATIVFGLSFATLLTLFVTPALYAIFYKI